MGEQEESPSIFGARVKQLRQCRGLTQQALAALADTSYTTIWRIERGSMRDTSLAVATRIAQALEVSVDLLVGRDHAGEAWAEKGSETPLGLGETRPNTEEKQ